MFATYFWTFLQSPRWRRLAAGSLAATLLFHAGLAIAQAPERSLYKNRAVVAAAIESKQPEMLGHRRAFAVEGGPPVLHDVPGGYNPQRDLVVSASYSIGFLGPVVWHCVLKNVSTQVAYRDVLYFSTYQDSSGRTLERRHEFIKDIIE